LKKYSEIINDLANQIPKPIVDISIPRKRGTAPTQAFSEFLSNREQGDWAEDLVNQASSLLLKEYDVVKYGKTDDIVAGDDRFKEFYNEYQDELDTIGKRPDILIFKKNIIDKKNISHVDKGELDAIVPKAIMGWEIRSSSYLTKKYKPSKTSKRSFLSFTPKVEDILVILKWVSKYNVPHFYVQVFFDAVYIISFQKILEIIIDPKNLKKLFFIEKNAKNQMKSTIHIDISQGSKFGDIIDFPAHESVRKELSAGRLLHHVKFKGGTLKIDEKVLKKAIEESTRYQ